MADCPDCSRSTNLCNPGDEVYWDHDIDNTCRPLSPRGFCCKRSVPAVQAAMQQMREHVFRMQYRINAKSRATYGDMTQPISGLRSQDMDHLLADLFPEANLKQLSELRRAFRHENPQENVILFNLVKFVDEHLQVPPGPIKKARRRESRYMPTTAPINNDAVRNKLQGMLAAKRNDDMRQAAASATSSSSAARAETCIVCMEDVSDIIHCMGQEAHPICKECLTGQLGQLPNLSSPGMVRCVGVECKYFYPAHRIIDIIGEIEVIRRQDRQEEVDFSVAGKVFQCYGCKLEGIIEGHAPGAPYRCPQCNMQYCTKCDTMHPELPWQPCIGPPAADDASIAVIRASTTPCTKCGAHVSLSAGCNHIVCRCGNEYCYKCGGRWSSAHHGCRKCSQCGGRVRYDHLACKTCSTGTVRNGAMRDQQQADHAAVAAGAGDAAGNVPTRLQAAQMQLEQTEARLQEARLNGTLNPDADARAENIVRTLRLNVAELAADEAEDAAAAAAGIDREEVLANRIARVLFARQTARERNALFALQRLTIRMHDLIAQHGNMNPDFGQRIARYLAQLTAAAANGRQ